MTSLFLAIITGLLIFLVIGGIYAYVKARRVVEEIATTVEDLFTARSEDLPSPFVQAVQQITAGLSEQIGVKTQAAIRGSIGGTMKGVNAALEREAIEQNPELAVYEALPKSLKKNQVAMLGLQYILNRVGAGKNEDRGNHSSQAKFSL